MRAPLLERLEELLDRGGTKKDVALLAVSAVALGFSFFAPETLPFNPAWIAIVLCGAPIILGAVIGLVTEFDIKADVLVSLALIAAVAIGEDFAAGEVALIMQLGALLEDLTVAKARAGIERLVHLSPRTARIVRDGVETVVAAEDVQVGDVLRVLPGETVAVDGTVLEGRTSIDESVMTGESLPVDKAPGDEVKSGTVNQFGRSTCAPSAWRGQLARPHDRARAVGRCRQGQDRAPRRPMATWIVVIALTAAAGTWLVTGDHPRRHHPRGVLPLRARAGHAHGHHGGHRQRDEARRARARRRCARAAGEGAQGGVRQDRHAHLRPPRSGGRRDDRGLEGGRRAAVFPGGQRGKHERAPLGKAVVRGGEQRGRRAGRGRNRGGLRSRGRGLRRTRARPPVVVRHGSRPRRARLGCRPRRRRRQPRDAGRAGRRRSRRAAGGGLPFAEQGCTVVLAALDGQAAGFIALADTVRPTAEAAVRGIRTLGVEPVLLTGDHAQAARHIAAQAGIVEVEADCLPQNKLAAVERLEREGAPVCMVGDGINDAPALKRASVGIAMGGAGSDIAVDAADIALVRDDIAALPHLLAISQRMMTTIKLNMGFSLGLNFVAIALAMTGILNPVVGALVHNAGSVIVIVNSALLLKWKHRGGSEASGDASPASAPGAATALRDLEPDAEAA
ncbi:MAG: heavy metal translocating P-type ATPase [Eggerthella lenta]